MIYYLHMIKTIFTVKNMIKKQYLQLKHAKNNIYS